MRRASAVSGLVLAALLAYRAVATAPAESAVVLGLGVVALGWSAWSTLHRRRRAQAVLCGLALVGLAEALPAYFQTYRVWPMLPVIFFATMSLGFGILGYVLDRFPGDRPLGPSL